MYSTTVQLPKQLQSSSSNGVGWIVSIYSTFRFLLPQNYHYSTSTGAAEKDAAEQLQKKSHHLLEDFLVNSLGFSKQEAISTSAKVKQPRLKPSKNPPLVVEFLQETGFKMTHVKKIVSANPELLYSKVDKTLKPKVEFVLELGLSGLNLIKFLMCCTMYFRRSLESQIKPNFEFLRKLLGNNEDVVKAIKRSTWMLSVNCSRSFSPNVLLLQKIGFSDERIQKLVRMDPWCILCKPGSLEKSVHKVENDLGIHRKSPMFIHAIAVFAHIKSSTQEGKFGIFRSFGWSNEDIVFMVRKLPYVVTLSEAKIRNALEFLMKELGYTVSYLASHPSLFCFSLERRLLPRNEVLKRLNEEKYKKRNISLYSAVILPEPKFLQRFVVPYKEKIPDMYKLYVKSVGGRQIENKGKKHLRKVKETNSDRVETVS